MKKSMEYLAKAMEYLEKCELESPYKNSVDMESAKRALQILELEHKIEEAKQGRHFKAMEQFQKERDTILEKIC
ncbi:MAG TPA: hypothetical protein VI583_03735 [Cyclobacteriaceae bacterium]|nr:hypothetical protein [Cyclobacteriaceae bacterium]